MMNSYGITGNATAAAPAAYGGGNRPEQGKQPGMDSNLFLQLLVAQMRYQDPLSSDQDTGEMVTQLAMFTLLEQVIKLQQVAENQGHVIEQSAALNLLNRQVEVVDENGTVFSGLVTAINFQGGQPFLTVNDEEFPYAALIKVEEGGPDNG